MANLQLRFLHRTNENGTVKSTCRQCSIDIASVRDERQLASLEHTHVCDPVRVYQLQNGVKHTFQPRPVELKD